MIKGESGEDLPLKLMNAKICIRLSEKYLNRLKF